MNVQEYARTKAININKIIRNANQLGLQLRRHSWLNKTEIAILDKISFMTIPEIRGYKVGLSVNSPEEILKSLQHLPLNENESQNKQSNIENSKKDNFDFKKLNDQIYKSDLHINKLTSKINVLEETVKALEESRIIHFKETELQINSLKDKINTLEGIVEEMIESDEQTLEYEKLKNRIVKIWESSFESQSIFPKLRNISDIQQDFFNQNLAYPKKFLEDIASALTENKHIIIVGPSGIGKTSLLKKMNLFYETNQNQQIKINYHSVASDWDNYDILGGKKLLKNKLVPHIGIFLESILECIETNQNILFVLDELTRGKADDMFSGIVDYLNGNSILTVKEFELVVEGFKSINVPQGIKIICATNKMDFNHLYHISQQMVRRFRVIEFNKNDTDLEIELIHKLLSNSKNKVGDSKYYQILDNYGAIIERIRKMEDELNLENPIFGTSYIIDALSVLETKEINKKNGFTINVDDIIRDNILLKIREFSPDVKSNLIRIFQDSKLSNCVNLLHKII